VDKLELLSVKVSRRAFIGGSLGLGFAFTVGISASQRAHGQAAARTLNAYVSIAADGTVTIQAPAAEMGQGINTGLALIVAEELDADWSKVVVQQSPVDAAYHHPIFKAQYFVASLATLGYWTPMRVAGAQARRVLMEAAAGKWDVPPRDVETRPGEVVHPASGRSMSYGEIASFAKVPEQLPAIDAAKDLKTPDKYRLIGKGVARVDIPAKTDGSAKYGIDARVPGMAYATRVRAPVRGSGPASTNADQIRKLPGIIDVLLLDDGVAIAGESYAAVAKARRQLKVSWRKGLPGDAVNSEKDFEAYRAEARDLKRPSVTWKAQGDAAAAINGAAKVVTREFLTDPVYHAQMEPMNATAYVRGDGAEVWVGTQAPTRTVLDVSKALGMSPEQVKVHQQLIGGGFGRRASVDTSIDAALVSKAIKRPVKLVLSREDDLVGGNFRPMTLQRIEAGLDAQGKLVGWRHRLVSEPVGDYLYHPGYLKAAKDRDVIVMMGADLPYYDKVPNWVSEHVGQPERSRVAAWRGVGTGYTKFAVECMLDELAYEARMDPLAYRLSITEVSRARRLLEKVAEMSGWGKKRPGTALGLAFGDLGVFTPKVGSMIASVAEVSVNQRSGQIRVHRYWAAADAGVAVNPPVLAAQIESATVWALSGALKERITLVDGTAQQSNFHDYPILRMAEMPEIKVEIVSSGPIPTMAGELGVPSCPPAVANAFFALTGKRLYHMPFTPERVRAALKA
jgi:isoquinoline 1-oxidoreductase beta subunit